MDRKKIYEASFDSMKQDMSGEDNSEKLKKSGNDAHALFNNMVYIVRPDRLRKSSAFQAKAVQVAEMLEMDIAIYEALDHICVELSFSAMPVMGFVKQKLLHLLQIADEVSFFPARKAQHDFLLTLLYYTHQPMPKGAE